MNSEINVTALFEMIKKNNIQTYDHRKYTLEDIANSIIKSRPRNNSFMMINLSSVINMYRIWKKHLPSVKIHYAVKCNPDKLILSTLNYLGTGFDVASQTEISLVRSLDITSDRLIFANAVKDANEINYAMMESVKKMTFDCEDELYKISKCYPNAELVLRILVDDSKARLPFGSKFGCRNDKILNLLILAKNLNLNIIGTSFHVGSGCDDPQSYCSAINKSLDVFNMASNLGFKVYLLDIGGGFPGDLDADKFITIANVINQELDIFRNFYPLLQVIAEPGRFFSTSCGTLCTSIIGKKYDDYYEKKFQYYVNSSIYGIFNNIIFDKATPIFEVINKKDDSTKYPSTIFGQTCDSMDKIVNEIMLPELSNGDWFIVKNHGAYTNAAASCFNGFGPCDIVYIFIF